MCRNYEFEENFQRGGNGRKIEMLIFLVNLQESFMQSTTSTTFTSSSEEGTFSTTLAQQNSIEG